MAIQAVPGGLWIGDPFTASVTPGLGVIGGITTATGKAAVVVAVPKTGNIRKVWWRMGATTTGDTLDVRLETIDATGNPSGTLVGPTTNGAQVVLAADDNVNFSTTLTADAAVTRGTVIAVVFANGALPGSWQVAALNNASAAGASERQSYVTRNPSGTWSTESTFIPLLALEYSDGTVAPLFGTYPPGPVTATSLSTSTTPDVLGVRFRLPAAVEVGGAWLALDMDGACAVRLVTTAYHQVNQTGVLASVTLSPARAGTSAGTFRVAFPTPVTLVAATDYRLIVEPTTATAIIVYDITHPGIALLDGWPGGRDWHLTTAKDPTSDASWTNYNSGTFRRPFLGLQVTGVDDGAGGGGGVTVAHGYVG